jgi:hypothetical protein
LDVFWTFSASSQAAIAVTANLAATADDLGIIVIAVNGCGNTSAPWDVNGSLPASISDLTAGLGTNSIPTVTGVSTTAPGTLICMFATNANSSSNPTSQTAQVLRRLPIKSHLLGRISPGVRSRPAHSPLRNPALRRRLGSRGIAGSHWQTRWLGPNGLGARGARQISTGGCKMTDDVEKAEHVLNNLRAKRDALVAHGIELGEERAKISFAAHTGDKGARQRLDKLNAEAALHESELRSLDAAIAEAGARVQQARTAEAAEKDKAAALGLRTTVKEIGDAMRYADSHLGKAIDALNAVNDALDRIHASGSDFPTNMQFAANAERALKTMLMRLPRVWWRDFGQHLAPNERRTFASFWAEMEKSLENRIRHRLGETAHDKTEAAA